MSAGGKSRPPLASILLVHCFIVWEPSISSTRYCWPGRARPPGQRIASGARSRKCRRLGLRRNFRSGRLILSPAALPPAPLWEPPCARRKLAGSPPIFLPTERRSRRLLIARRDKRTIRFERWSVPRTRPTLYDARARMRGRSCAVMRTGRTRSTAMALPRQTKSLPRNAPTKSAGRIRSRMSP